MFDFRYHVASLAAVFLALIVGILVGVGISSQDVVAKSERDLLRNRADELQRRLDRANQRILELRRSQDASQDFVQATYAALVANRLRGENVALVFVGSVDGGTRSAVEQLLDDSNAAGLVRMRALRVPLDLEGVDGILAKRPALARFAGEEHLGDLGDALAGEFVLGGETPLWNALEGRIVEERLGDSPVTADAVVVVRSTAPQRGGTARFLGGFYRGLASSLVPAVGIESTTTELSAVEAFRRGGISSVDDVDTAPGRLALAVLLAGGRPGHYGVKETAKDGLLPPVDPVEPPPRG